MVLMSSLSADFSVYHIYPKALTGLYSEVVIKMIMLKM